MKKYKIIIDFLKVIGATREAKRYLKLFQKGDPTRFAIIRIGGGVIQESKDLIAVDLAYLSSINLYPIVIHGGGPQIDNALKESGIRFKKIDGLRITTRKQLPIIKRALDRINAELVSEIQKFGGFAIGLTEDIFIAEKHPDERLGYAGTVKKVMLAPIIRAIKAKKIPVVSCLGFDEEGRIYNINADTAARAVVRAVKPKKYILITEEGGVRDDNWEIISHINLTEELEPMIKRGVLKDGMLHKVREVDNLLNELKYNLVVQIAPAGRLLKELFTDKGSGTFIKRGADIQEYYSYGGIDKDKLRKLLEKSFGRELKSGYFEKPISFILLDNAYRGTAIVQPFNSGFYLDKFCVKDEAQGEGIASDIWNLLIKKCNKLFWRSKPSNPINSWYFENASGCIKFPKWYFFWINLTDDEIKPATDYAINLEESLVLQKLDQPALQA